MFLGIIILLMYHIILPKHISQISLLGNDPQASCIMDDALVYAIPIYSQWFHREMEQQEGDLLLFFIH